MSMTDVPDKGTLFRIPMGDNLRHAFVELVLSTPEYLASLEKLAPLVKKDTKGAWTLRFRVEYVGRIAAQVTDRLHNLQSEELPRLRYEGPPRDPFTTWS